MSSSDDRSRIRSSLAGLAAIEAAAVWILGGVVPAATYDLVSVSQRVATAALLAVLAVLAALPFVLAIRRMFRHERRAIALLALAILSNVILHWRYFDQEGEHSTAGLLLFESFFLSWAFIGALLAWDALEVRKPSGGESQ